MPLLFYDPKHGGCLRRVERRGEHRYVIHGVYGNDEAPQRAGDYWWAEATVESRTAHGVEEWLVDFHPGKPLKRDRFLRATHRPSERRIDWQDGNTWRALFFHPRQLKRGRSSSRSSLGSATRRRRVTPA